MSEPIKATTRMTLDLSLTGIQKSLTVTQGDTNRRMEITLTNSGSPFPLSKKWTVALSAIKPDGALLFNGCVVDHGRILYDFASGEEIATCVGGYEAKFVVYDEAGDPVATPKIWINVLRKGTRDIASADQFTAARELVRRLTELGDDVALLESLVDQGGPLASVLTLTEILPTAWVKREGEQYEAPLSFPDLGPNMAVFLIPADEITRKAATEAALYINADRPSLDATTAVAVSAAQPPREALLFLCLTVKGNSYTVGDPLTEGMPPPEEILHHPPAVTFVGISAGGGALKKTFLSGSGTLDLTVDNGRIYSITGYSDIRILPPERETYMAHLFVKFPKTETVSFRFPEGLSLYGTDPSLAAPGDNWEVNIDSEGGILLMRKRALS